MGKIGIFLVNSKKIILINAIREETNRMRIMHFTNKIFAYHINGVMRRIHTVTGKDINYMASKGKTEMLKMQRNGQDNTKEKININE